MLASSGFRVANNTVRDFKSDGISVESSSTGVVDGNTIQFYHSASSSSDDGDQGIRVVNGARAEVTGGGWRRARVGARPAGAVVHLGIAAVT